MQRLGHDFIKKKLLSCLLPFSLPSYTHNTGWPALMMMATPIRATPACFKDNLTLTLLRRMGQLFCRMPSIWIGLIVPHDQIEVMHFGKQYHRSEGSLRCPIRDYLMSSVCLLLVMLTLCKVKSARFLHYKVSICLFVIKKCLVSDNFEAIQISCFSSNFAPLIFSTHQWILSVTIITKMF